MDRSSSIRGTTQFIVAFVPRTFFGNLRKIEQLVDGARRTILARGSKRKSTVLYGRSEGTRGEDTRKRAYSKYFIDSDISRRVPPFFGARRRLGSAVCTRIAVFFEWLASPLFNKGVCISRILFSPRNRFLTSTTDRMAFTGTVSMRRACFFPSPPSGSWISRRITEPRKLLFVSSFSTRP